MPEMVEDPLPPEFMREARSLEAAYLAHPDPIRQSGFSAGAERWRAERGPILRAVDRDGDLLDMGCANGYLVECLVGWAAERGVRLAPHGVDIGPKLIRLARERLPSFADNFHVGNVWDWRPPRRYTYVYALWDCVPADRRSAYVLRLFDEFVEDGGRLIVGAYGSRSRRIAPPDVAAALRSFGLRVEGQAAGGDPPVTNFAWVCRPIAGERS
jgi:hypothetical protein